MAIFSSPLYWSSQGSHLPHAPWEHLAPDREGLRRRLLASVEASWSFRLGRALTAPARWLAGRGRG